MTEEIQLDNLSRQIWKELKTKVNLQYYLGGPRFGHIDRSIGDPDIEDGSVVEESTSEEPTTEEPSTEEPSSLVPDITGS